MSIKSTEPTIKEEVDDKVFNDSSLNSQTQLDLEKIKIEKNNSEVKNSKVTIKVESEENNEAGKTSDPVPEKEIKSEDLRRKRILSEGEASSGFETVSSADCNDGMDDLGLSPEFEDEDYNLIVRIANELAYAQGGQPGRTYPPKKKKKRKKANTHANKKDSYLGEHLNRHQDGFKAYKEDEHWQTKIDNKSTNFEQSCKKSSEDENFGDGKRSTSRDYNWKKDGHLYERPSNVRRNEYDRFRRSRSNENVRFRKSRSQDRNDRNVRSRSPSSKDRKTDRRHNSCDKSNPRSSSTNRRRTRSPVSRSSNAWKRVNSKERYTVNKKRRRKERTPFLVELERKLKEADQQKSSKKETKPEPTETQVPEKPSEIPKPPEIPQAINLPPNPPPPDTHVLPAPNFYPIQYPLFPTKSLDNLPLVPGPTGLPVHVTITGEQIPHDMDGKRIPVGPNGYYLPLDPTGRLFPHIVSPGNQAVPIHMTEDGVLRLPNSEPVPVGPGHKFPVNIDGNIIVIGADSKPLHPCNNLPREPPIHLLQMMNTESAGHGGTQPLVPQMGHHQVNSFNNGGNFFQPTATVNGPVENNFNEKQEPNNSGRNNFRGRGKDVLKCIKIKKNTPGIHSKGDGKQKTSQKETSKTNGCHSDSDMVLDSGDSDSASTSKPNQKSKKVIPEEILVTSSDEEILLEKILVKSTGTSVKDVGTTRKEIITKRVQKTIKSLLERKYTPPAAGRFIISSHPTNHIINKSPNESPLLRNRIKLAFLTPNWKTFPPKDQSIIEEKNSPKFKFLPKKNSETKENRLAIQGKSEKSTLVKFPVFTFDFAMQCDFTSGIIKDLTAKVTALEAELAWLKNCNANLKNGYKNIEIVNQKQTDELKKALLEIQSLKGLFESWD